MEITPTAARALYAERAARNAATDRETSAAADTFFELLIGALQATQNRLWSAPAAGAEVKAAIAGSLSLLMRHGFVAYQLFSEGHTFFAWLAFRPGLEAAMMIGIWIDDPGAYATWRNRDSDPASYQRVFWGINICSAAIARAPEMQKVLARLNAEFVHPNPDYRYRDPNRERREWPAFIDDQVMGERPEWVDVHKAAFLHFLGIVASEVQSALDRHGLAVMPPLDILAEHSPIGRALDIAHTDAAAAVVLRDLGLVAMSGRR